MKQIGFVSLIIGIILMLMNYLYGGLLVLAGIFLMIAGKKHNGSRST